MILASELIFILTYVFPLSSGAIRVAGDLSPLAGRIAYFRVWASDSGYPRLEAATPAIVYVKVEKQNMFAPLFTSSRYEALVHLPTIAGVEVLCVKSIDPDDLRGKNSTFLRSHYEKTNHKTNLIYSLESDDDQSVSYRLDSETGCLYVQETELKKGKHEISVSVSDGTFKTSTKVSILVDEQEVKPMDFTQPRYFAHVLENSTNSVNLLIVKVDEVPLNHHVFYTILNPNKFITVGKTSGVVRTTGEPLDREVQEYYSLIVQVIDTSIDVIFVEYFIHLYQSHEFS